jgi:2-iminobutanoate/2-iminopropanoate deaminase
MEREVIQSADAPAAIGPYSQAIAVRAERTVYCSGQIALDPATGQVVGGNDVVAQARRVLDNLAAVLAAASMSFEHVVKTTIYLVDMNDFAAVNEVYAERFGSAPPARATVAVAALPKGVRVEIDAIAVG